MFYVVHKMLDGWHRNKVLKFNF